MNLLQGDMKMKKEQKLLSFHKMGILMCLFCLLFPMIIHASALKKLSEKELVDLADVIVIGQVDKKEARWVGQHIETTFGIRAKEYWKGDLGASFDFTQMGGELQRPLPITMQADGAPGFFEGEQVILFLEKPEKNPNGKGASTLPPESRLPASCKVVGWAQGKYTIIKDSKTNQDKVVRLGMEDMRVLDRREMDRRIEAAKLYSGLSSKQEKPVKTEQIQASTPFAGKAPKKASGAPYSRNLKAENKEISFDANSLNILDLPKRENLEDFKLRIKGFLK
jgi:hypothetical protein